MHCHMTKPRGIHENLHKTVEEHFTTESLRVPKPINQAQALMTPQEKRGTGLIEKTTKFEELEKEVTKNFKNARYAQPALSPWWGGAWKTLKQSVKKCIELVFVLLTWLLTPDMALLEDESEVGTLHRIFTETDAINKLLYRKLKALADRMVSRWTKEYLPTICRRSKWYTDTKPVDPTTPRSSRKKGKKPRFMPALRDQFVPPIFCYRAKS